MSKQIATIFSTALLLVATSSSAAFASTEKSASASSEKSALLLPKNHSPGWQTITPTCITANPPHLVRYMTKRN